MLLFSYNLSGVKLEQCQHGECLKSIAFYVFLVRIPEDINDCFCLELVILVLHK